MSRSACNSDPYLHQHDAIITKDSKLRLRFLLSLKKVSSEHRTNNSEHSPSVCLRRPLLDPVLTAISHLLEKNACGRGEAEVKQYCPNFEERQFLSEPFACCSY